MRLLTNLSLRYSALVVVAFALLTVFFGYRATQEDIEGLKTAVAQDSAGR